MSMRRPAWESDLAVNDGGQVYSNGGGGVEERGELIVDHAPLTPVLTMPTYTPEIRTAAVMPDPLAADAAKVLRAYGLEKDPDWQWRVRQYGAAETANMLEAQYPENRSAKLLMQWGVADDDEWQWRAANYSSADLENLLVQLRTPPPLTAPALTRTTPVSLLSSLAKGVGSAVGGFFSGGPVGAAAGAISSLTRKAAPAAPQLLGGGARSMVPIRLPTGLVGGAVGVGGQLLGSYLGGKLSSSSSSCGCNHSNGRDPCTHQRMSSQPAPLATFFGGCCPPGRTLRRKPMGRDVCIKTPRMNVLNPHALRRANRRVTGFARTAAPILKQLGFQVSATRKAKGVKIGGRKRRR